MATVDMTRKRLESYCMISGVTNRDWKEHRQEQNGKIKSFKCNPVYMDVITVGIPRYLANGEISKN